VRAWWDHGGCRTYRSVCFFQVRSTIEHSARARTSYTHSHCFFLVPA
jgi:hypothetical protein